ncbi:MAG TPA: TPM domain-containing protein [Phenylobacterium sp.]|uniref:TPM domain-containing protein n=1 Tax=Phenylobacterium sp. TaxID=1871053 RepID=UPI002B49D926|nr:TPM domain-containing protein [Phenylobacterium sp.]HKR88516.1 TPM domain-containing protein [Phenylobacterium sp.]
MALAPSDLAAIEAAITDAEARTTGEIYCVVTDQSGDYAETPLAWAAGAALLGPALLLLGGIHVTAPDLVGGWAAEQVGEVAERAARSALIGAIVLQAALFVATLVLVALPPLRLALTPRVFKRDRVRRRALEQFAAKNMHLTRERTGVLIFVSFGERMAELIADEGIAAHVEARVWDEAMAALVAGLRRGEAGTGVAAAVRLCGEVLAERFPPTAQDNPDELPNAVVILPRV